MFASLMRYFIEVAREGSVRGAAEKLHIAASAINRHIIEYEEQLGTPLFERLPRGMKLTEAGQILYEAAKKLQQDYAYAISEVDLLKQSKRGHVSLATLHAFAEDLVPPIIERLLREFPGINYTFFVRTSTDAAALVAADEADLGLTYDPPLGLPLAIIKRAPIAYGVVARPGHPLARHTSLRLGDCAGFPLVMSRTGKMRELLDRMQAGSSEKLRPAVETESVPMMRELVMNGDGVGFISLAAVLFEVSRGDLIFRPLADQTEVQSSLCLYAKEGRALPAAVKLLCDRLVDGFPAVDEQYRLQTARTLRTKQNSDR